MRNKGFTPRLLVMFFLFPLARVGHSYQWPIPNSQGLVQQPINSTLGEYRDTTTSACPGPCPHFHDGVDIGGSAGTDVFAVVGGTVVAVQSDATGSTGDGFVTIQMASGRFTYFHILPNATTLALNSSVQTGQFLGTIASIAHPHLHFKETDLSGNVLNPLRAGALTPYSDTTLPQVLSVQLLNANAPAGSPPIGPAVGASVPALDIRAQAHDLQSLGSQNVGVYQIGYQIGNLDTGNQTSNFPEQTYLTIPSGLIFSPGNAYDTTISQGGFNGIFQFDYFASNPINAQTPLSLGSLADGHYQICVLAADIKGNQNAVVNNPSACASMILDRTPPGLTVFDSSPMIGCRNDEA